MEARMEQILATSNNPVLSIDKNGCIIYSNEAGITLLNEWGVKVGQKLPSNVVDIFQKVFSRNSPEKIEIKVGIKAYLVVFSPLLEQECVNISGFDISEQKEVEGKLRDRENRYRNIVDTSVEGIWIFNEISETTYVNNKMAEMLGYKPEEMIGRFIWDFASEEDYNIFQVKLVNRKRGLDEVYELKLLRKDGYPILFSVSVKGFFDDAGKFEGSVGMFTDITDYKRTEGALRESNARIESIFRSSPIGIGVVVKHMIAGVNERLCDMTGYSREELLGNSASMLYLTAEEFERVILVKYDMISKCDRGYVETQWQRKDGSIIDILLSSSPVVSGDLTGEITFTALDITERKQYEEALKKSQEFLEEKVKERTIELEEAYNSLNESKKSLAEAQEMAHIGNWEWDIKADKAYWSEEMYRIFKRDPQKLAPSLKEYLSYIHPDDLDYYCKVNDYNRKVSASGLDFRIVLANGEKRTLHIKSDFIFDDKKNPTRVKGIVQDITESKKAEEEIQNLANIVESSSDAIGTLSLDGTITSWNKGAEQIYGYSMEEVLGRSVSILATPFLHDETKKLSELVIRGEKVHQYETFRERKDGKIIYVSIALSPVFDNYGKLTAISFIVRDITKRKEAEDALARIEIARKQEIHHRIKNNLQVISSLLDLQAENFKSKQFIKENEVLVAFKESQDRVISMALIHEELHKGGKLDTLNFSHYIDKLADNLLLTYRLGNENISLDKDFDEDIFFDMDTAVPLGIIINELISNSLKYAFSDRDNGEIHIKLHREENRESKSEDYNPTYVLSVSDNGMGIPKDLDIENLDSLGLQLVTTLVEQLDGEFELKRNNGTELIIRFSVTGNNDQELVQDQLQIANNEKSDVS